MSENPTDEFQAFQQIHQALVALDPESRARVISSISTLLSIHNPASPAPHKAPVVTEISAASIITEPAAPAPNDTFTEFAELYAAAMPNAGPEKALVAGYWLQVCEGAESFSGHSVNNSLNHLGHKIANVTTALSALISMKPQLVLQLKKSGKSQQARKSYKLSMEGIKRVKEMIRAA